jgi:hypothetical protein
MHSTQFSIQNFQGGAFHMKRKFPIAIFVAVILLVLTTSLAFAAIMPAHIAFTTDAPCAVTVIVDNYTDPSGQPNQSASGSTPWTLDVYPSTSVTFYYPSFVVCNGTTYNFVSAQPGSPLSSGAEDSTITVVGHYTLPISDTTPPVWTVPASFSVEATGPAGAVVTYTASATDPDDAVSSQSCSPASGATFPLGTTTVTCTAADTHENTGTAQFDVTVVDTTPPALTLPGNLTVTAEDASGALVNFTASANDLVDGSVAVTCQPASGSFFPLGITVVNCSATDSHGNTASTSFTVSVQYATGINCGGVAGHQILPPINTDGSSVFKQGRVVPVKFRVCTANGDVIASPGVVTGFRLVQIISAGSVSNVDQSVVSATSDSDFRIGHQQWMFNLSTKDLAAGNTYVYLITLNDGSTIQFQFSLK